MKNALIFFVLGLISTRCWSDSKKENSKPVVSPQYRWSVVQWDGDEKLYKAANKKIGGWIGNKDLLKENIEKLNSEAMSDPENSLSQYKIAYAYYLLDGKTHGAVEPKLFQHASDSLSAAPFPPNYYFARLRYIMEARFLPENELKFAGRKLLTRNPKDYEIAYYQLSVLDPGEGPKEQMEAEHIAKELITANLKRPHLYFAIGAMYYKAWLANSKKTDAQKAVKAYQTFLKNADAKDTQRRAAESAVKLLSKQY